MVVFRDYVIFYRHSREKVIIERVLHGARDIQGLL
jgi:plasmid stabilization system protein ParE